MAKKDLVECKDCLHRGNYENYMWHCQVLRIGRSTMKRECKDFKQKK